ncbi:methyl-accepting chemotaxis protein, partial [Spirochaetota bacterium]
SIASSLEQMTATVKGIAQHSESARMLVKDTVGGFGNVTSQVEKLNLATNEINKVIDDIVDIAGQTKLLAVNATIEASHAGEAGKGFAVVANEVKELARQTNDATLEIQGRINAIQDSTESTISEIKKSNKLINNTNEVISSIASEVEEQSTVAQDVADNINQATKGINEISSNIKSVMNVSANLVDEINQIDKVSKELLKSNDETKKNTESFSEIINKIKSITEKFKV